MLTNARRNSGLAALFLFGAASCRSKPAPKETLPTPMTLGTPATAAVAKATPAAVAPVVNTGAPATGNRAPIVSKIAIEASGGGPGDLHPSVHDTLTAIIKADDPDGDLVTIRRRWVMNGVELGTGETLPPGQFKKGNSVTLEVIATDAHGQESTPAHNSIAIRNSPPDITSIPSGSLNGYHPVAVDPDGDPVTIELAAPVPGFTFSGGTLTFDAAAGKEAAGKVITFVAKDNEGATTTQSITITL